jgi:hypothetical protein
MATKRTVPLSMLEAFLAAFIVKKISSSRENA